MIDETPEKPPPSAAMMLCANRFNLRAG